MASMKWVKPTASTIAYFERLAPGAPLETRRMFGMPCRFLNGHMLVGVFENVLMLHLGAEDRAACIRAGAKPFKPMGREMREYVMIRPKQFSDRELKQWIVRGMRYLASLVPKGPRNVRPTTIAPPSKRAKPKPTQKPSSVRAKRRTTSVKRRPAKKGSKKPTGKATSRRAAAKKITRHAPQKQRPTPRRPQKARKKR